MKTQKELWEKIYEDVLINHMGRQVELEHLEGWGIPQAKKIKNKEEREGAMAQLENNKKQIEYEIKSRTALLKTLKKKLK